MNEYGARPVSVDLARTLSPRPDETTRGQAPVVPAVRRLNQQQVDDRLALAHWPPGHQIAVCSLAGGVGRTTVSGLLATVLAELPYAHVWPTVGLVEADSRPFSDAPDRRGQNLLGDAATAGQASGAGGRAAATRSRSSAADRSGFSVVVIDSPVGRPSDLDRVASDPAVSVVLVVRPDVTSLGRSADALVWMNDHTPVARSRVFTIVNQGAGRSDPGSRTASTALGIRCAAVHRLPAHRSLGPSRPLPSGHAIPPVVRRPIARLALEVWRQAVQSTPPSDPLHPQELR